MINLSKILIRRFIADWQNTSDFSVKKRYGYLEAIISIVLNVVLFAVKLELGILANSISLIADALHSLSDVFTSGIVLFGFKFGSKAPDEEHPFGHARLESIAALVIAMLLLFAAYKFLVGSIDRFLHPVRVIGSPLTIIMISLTIVVKEWMARFSMYMGREINSSSLKADAWHHRTDAISTLMVLAALVAARYDFFLLDPIMGIGVCVIIAFTAIKIFREAADKLIGKRAPEEFLNELRQKALSVAGVSYVDDFQVHDYISRKIVSFRVKIASGLSLGEANVICSKVEQLMVHSFDYLTPVVRMDPTHLHVNGTFEQRVQEAIGQFPEVLYFHFADYVIDAGRKKLDLYIVVDRDMSLLNAHDLVHGLKSQLNRSIPGLKTHIHVEPCIFDCRSCFNICPKNEFLAT